MGGSAGESDTKQPEPVAAATDGPDCNPVADAAATREDVADYLVDMIREDLVAERIAIDSYAEMIRYLGDDDPTTRRMLESILAAEEEHTDDLISLLRGSDVR